MPETITNADNFVRVKEKNMDLQDNTSLTSASLTNTYRKSYPSCLDINSISSKSINNLRKVIINYIDRFKCL